MKLLLLDIETSPNIALVWGLFNQNIAIDQIVDSAQTLCWAAKWVGSDEVMFESRRKAGHRQMIRKMYKLLEEADAVIHYNGKKFDIPVLNKEFVSLKMVPPKGYKQIDLYHVVRKVFRFPSNKLDYVLRALGIGAKVKHKGMQLWVDCMNNDPEAWKAMEEYNIGDIVPLEGLYNRLLPWITTHPNHALYTDNTRPVCTNCGSEAVIKKGVETTKTQQYQRYKCKDCGTNMRSRFNITDEKKRHNVLVQASF